MDLVEIYSTKQSITLLVKNVGSAMYGEQQLVIQYSLIVVISAPKKIIVQNFNEVHKNKTKQLKFKTTFEMKFGFFIWLCLLLLHKFFHSSWGYVDFKFVWKGIDL
jgi:hypothetical protein